MGPPFSPKVLHESLSAGNPGGQCDGSLTLLKLPDDDDENQEVSNENTDDNDDDDMNDEWEQDQENIKNINEQFMAAARDGYMEKDKGFIKAIRNFYKRLKNRLSNRKTLTNNLGTFGQETDDCVVPGRKRRHTTM